MRGLISLAIVPIAVASLWVMYSFRDAAVAEHRFKPRVSTEDVEGLAVREDLLRMGGSIDWQGLDALRQHVSTALKDGTLPTAKLNSSVFAPDWNEVGPSNTGGRTRAMATMGDVLYAGGVSGGLWRSENRGSTWAQVSTFPNLMVGSIAIAGNGDLYVGTGSNFDGSGGQGGSGFRGDGIWRATASNPGAFEKVTLAGGGDFDVLATDALVADPRECYTSRVWVASMEGYGYIDDGEFVELSGAATTLSSATDMAIAPDGSYCLVVGSNGRVYRSLGVDANCIQGGGDFTNLASLTQAGSSNNLDGNLPQSGIGRARVDISSDTLDNGTYSAFALYSSSGGLFYGLYFSEWEGNDGGWDLVWPGEAGYTPLPRAQGYYDLALGIAKGYPDLAYVGGIELWRSGPNQQAELAAVPLDSPLGNVFMHPDVHEIMFAEDGTMYVATDGGIYRSDDVGETYLEVNQGYNVTQFYGMVYGPGGETIGGSQDNGSLLMMPYHFEAQQVHGGDGFDSAISQRRPDGDSTLLWIASSQNGGVVRGTYTPQGAINQGSFYDGAIGQLLNNEGELGGFYTCIRLYEDEMSSAQNMFALGLTGSLGIWMTRESLNFNTTPTWIRLTNAPGGGGSKAIEFVEHDNAETDVAGDVMFVTGWNGQVTRISGLRSVQNQVDVDNGALTATNILTSAGAAVTGLSIDPNDPNHVVIAVGGYGTSSNGKVRETFNALSPSPSWSNIWSSSGFNNMPCYDVVVDVNDPTGQTILVGTEFGVFVTDNGGTTWSMSNSGMSSAADQLGAPVFDLKQQTHQGLNWDDVSNFGEIYAATHGRGMFATQDLQGCTDALACNFWRGATVDNGTCEYSSCKGCLDSQACNFNPSASVLVECDYSCFGCTESNAINFDPSALYDDGSCFSTIVGCEQGLMQDWSGLGLGWWPGDTSAWILGQEDILHTVFYLPDSLQVQDNATVPSVSFDINAVSGLPEGLEFDGVDANSGETVCWVIEGTPLQPGTFEVVVSGDLIFQIFGSQFSLSFSFSHVAEVHEGSLDSGCTYADAVNYDASTTIDDGSCEFAGCTDSAALNFNPAYSQSDGSCIYELTASGCPEDVNDDNQVNTSDLLTFLTAYGVICD